ncbi:MAG TPA: hypothetical protein VH933_00120 [Aestuariivirgaceae bacterium]
MINRLVVLSAIALSLFTVPVQSAESPLSTELPPDQTTCWERVYDEAHLKKHPLQQVTAVKLLHQPSPMGFEIDLMFKLRTGSQKGKDTYEYMIIGFCKPNRGGLSCENEWEAGTWRIEQGAAGTLMVRNGGLTVNPINYSAEDVAPGAVKIGKKPDDAAWRLSKAPDAECEIE